MPVHRTAYLLGYLALLPFVGAALAAWLPLEVPRLWVNHALFSYAATVVSFIGGIHWGLAMRQQQPALSLYAWGVVPAIVAWLLSLAPAPWQVPGLAALLVACYAVDRRVYPRQGVAAWLALRLQLTAVAVVCCVLCAVAA
jgi:Protein of unknown function (DUF3429)